MPTITEQTIAEIDAEMAKWAEFLNFGVGVTSFGTAISCIGTPRPDITGLMALAFYLVLMIYGSDRFPRKVLELRKAKLEGIDSLTLVGIEKKNFGLRAAMHHFPVFMVGWSFLGCVTLYGLARTVKLFG
jgi:hypothetical protein